MNCCKTKYPTFNGLKQLLMILPFGLAFSWTILLVSPKVSHAAAVIPRLCWDRMAQDRLIQMPHG